MSGNVNAAQGGAHMWFAPLVLVFALGCVPSATLHTAEKRADNSPRQVKLGGNVRDLGEVQRAAVSRDEFLVKVNELLAAQRPAAARRFIERYPDVALDVLRSYAQTQPAMALIAQVHDEQCGSGDAASGWCGAKRSAAYDTARPRYVECLKTKAKDALGMRLPDPGSLPLQLDAAQLQADALLQAEKPAEAEALLVRGLRSSNAQPYAAAQLMLVLSEAQRRAGKIEPAAATWRQAVERASERLVCDPIFWERASYLRPVEEQWPESVAQRLAYWGRQAPEGQATSRPEQREALVWCGIGQMRLDRREAQSALLAFKRAESYVTELPLRNRLQLGQARALLQAEQLPSAAALLVRLTAVADTEVSLPALALLGAVKLQKGSIEQAMALLQRAVTADWPGRGDAEADLGLAYLSLGDDANGMKWLHGAQARFTAAGDRAALGQCLTNELHYLEHKKKQEEAEQVRLKLRMLDNG